MEEGSRTNNQDEIRFSMTYSLDRDKFFRRECPNCGRQFKTQADEDALVSSIRPIFREAGLDFGELDTNDEDPPQLICPYCEQTAPSSEMLTSTFVRYIERYIYREYVYPMIHQILSGFSDKLNRSSRRSSGGLISFEISSDYSRAIPPPRPISGPEPPDMTAVDMLCCGKSIKIMDAWYGLDRCPYCASQVILT